MIPVQLPRQRMMHVFATLIFSLVGGTAAAQQLGGGIFAYPDAGQSQKQQQKDQMECHQWATGQTGIDPARNRPPQTGQGYSSSYSSSSGSGFGSREVGEGGMVGDAARGAAFGAMFGAIAGDMPVRVRPLARPVARCLAAAVVLPEPLAVASFNELQPTAIKALE